MKLVIDPSAGPRGRARRCRLHTRTGPAGRGRGAALSLLSCLLPLSLPSPAALLSAPVHPAAVLTHACRRGQAPPPAPPPSLDHPARGPCFGGTRELAPRKDGRRGRGRVSPAGRGLQVQRVGASPAPRRPALGSCCLGRCVTSLSLIYKPG